jgi:hypothetical protein
MVWVRKRTDRATAVCLQIIQIIYLSFNQLTSFQEAYRPLVREGALREEQGNVWLLVLSDLTSQQLRCKLQTRPLAREGALWEEQGNVWLISMAWPDRDCTVSYRPVLSSERALQNNKPATV